MTQDFPPEIYTNWATGVASSSEHIPFAIDAAGVDRDATEVARGLACGCRCPACGGPVVARQGEVRAYHFAHYSRQECVHALEASLFRATLASLTEPGAVLRLPPIGDRRALAGYHGVVLDEIRAAKFFAQRWVIEPETAVLTGVETITRDVADSNSEVPDVVVAGLGLRIHLLSYRKSVTQVRESLGAATGLVLGIDVRTYAKLWWDSCEKDREGKAVRASRSLRRWLRDSEDGRGWLSHPEFEARMVKLRTWVTEHPNPARGHTTNSGANPNYPMPAEAAQRVEEMEDQPDRVLKRGVGFCELCTMPLNEIVFGSGEHSGRHAIVCSHYYRHHTELLD